MSSESLTAEAPASPVSIIKSPEVVASFSPVPLSAEEMVSVVASCSVETDVSPSQVVSTPHPSPVKLPVTSVSEVLAVPSAVALEVASPVSIVVDSGEGVASVSWA